MIEATKNFFIHLWHTTDVTIINLAIFGLSFTQIEFGMKVCTFLFGMAYGIWRWRKELKKK